MGHTKFNSPSNVSSNTTEAKKSSHRKRKTVTPNSLGVIRSLKDYGLDNKKISEYTGYTTSTISNRLKRDEEHQEQFPDKTRIILDDKTLRKAAQLYLYSQEDFSNIIENLNLNCTPSTLKHRLISNHLINSNYCKMFIMISKKLKEKRLNWCKNLLKDLNEQDFVSLFVFSNEFGFKFFSRVSNRWVYFKPVTPQPNVCLDQGEKEFLVWGAISYDEKHKLTFFKKNDSTNDFIDELVKRIVWPEFKEEAYKLYQPDNIPLLNTNRIQYFLKEKKISKFVCPSKSPDLNVIESLWHSFLERIYRSGKRYKSADELKTMIREEWKEFSSHSGRNLYESFIKRIHEVIYMEGDVALYF